MAVKLTCDPAAPVEEQADCVGLLALVVFS